MIKLYQFIQILLFPNIGLKLSLNLVGMIIGMTSMIFFNIQTIVATILGFRKYNFFNNENLIFGLEYTDLNN